jgi:hypothetical protein
VRLALRAQIAEVGSGYALHIIILRQYGQGYIVTKRLSLGQFNLQDGVVQIATHVHVCARLKVSLFIFLDVPEHFQVLVHDLAIAVDYSAHDRAKGIYPKETVTEASRGARIGTSLFATLGEAESQHPLARAAKIFYGLGDAAEGNVSIL